jgi:hypothetical protein
MERGHPVRTERKARTIKFDTAAPDSGSLFVLPRVGQESVRREGEPPIFEAHLVIQDHFQPVPCGIFTLGKPRRIILWRRATRFGLT